MTHAYVRFTTAWLNRSRKPTYQRRSLFGVVVLPIIFSATSFWSCLLCPRFWAIQVTSQNSAVSAVVRWPGARFC